MLEGIPKMKPPRGVELQEPTEPQLCWVSALPARARWNPAGKPPLGAALRAVPFLFRPHADPRQARVAVPNRVPAAGSPRRWHPPG